VKILSKNIEETSEVAKGFLNKLQSKTDSATVVGLFGNLGSGKTTFTQALGKSLGVTEFMTSPTFVIEKIYLLKNSKVLMCFKKLIHIDAYRLESGQELLSLDFKEILKDPKNLILIEWPERVADVLPSDLIKVNFKFITEFEREIEII
jgi:tRNA threonylcarbamoyladenosine biosynthesis protein TsaE